MLNGQYSWWDLKKNKHNFKKKQSPAFLRFFAASQICYNSPTNQLSGLSNYSHLHFLFSLYPGYWHVRQKESNAQIYWQPTQSLNQCLTFPFGFSIVNIVIKQLHKFSLDSIGTMKINKHKTMIFNSNFPACFGRSKN